MSAQLSRDDWKGHVGGLAYRNQAIIAGKFVPSLTGKTFDCVNPATGQVLTQVAACEQADVDAAVKAARAAFDKGIWANMPASRKRIMLKLAELMMKNRGDDKQSGIGSDKSLHAFDKFTQVKTTWIQLG